MWQEVVEAFHRAARLRREDVFGDAETLLPIKNQDDAKTAAPGWVGSDWRSGGTLLVAINPGGGSDKYKRNPTDERLYGSIRVFRDASTEREQAEALAALSAAWIEIQRTHKIWTIIEKVLNATGDGAERSAFLNIVPFRTRGNATPRVADQQRAWQRATAQQVRALAPERIVALGQKTYMALTRLGATSEFSVLEVLRTNGDRYVHADARAALDRLRASLARPGWTQQG